VEERMKRIKETIAEIGKEIDRLHQVEADAIKYKDLQTMDNAYTKVEKLEGQKQGLIEGYLIAIENEIEFLESCKIWNGTRPLEIRDKVLLEELDIKIKELKQKVGA
jgi:ATP-dependent DNA ligase